MLTAAYGETDNKNSSLFEWHKSIKAVLEDVKEDGRSGHSKA